MYTRNANLLIVILQKHSMRLQASMQQATQRNFTRIIWVLAFLMISLPAFSQINLKAKARSNSAIFLRWNEGNVAEAKRLQMPGMEHFAGYEHIQALSKTAQAEISDIYTLQFPEDTDLKAQIAALLATGQFEWVEENRKVNTHAAVPNDPQVGEQWYHPYIETFAAWDTTRGDATVVVGVLDTGIDYGHPEFAGQIAVKASEDANGNGSFEPWSDTLIVSGLRGDFDGIDQDGNGYTDDVIGWDFTDQPRSPFGGDYLFEDANPDDDNNHGTLVSGIIAARADNNYGGAGIAPGCKLKILRAFSGSGAGEDDDIARAIVYAADNGIRILNFSFGDIYPSLMMHEAIKYAAQKGVVMIASAGNGTGDNLHYPSNFDEVISVSASALAFGGSTEILWPLSSHGHAVSLCAPGSGIYAPMVRDTSHEEDFDYFSGTSTSAPMVSAAVALLFSQRGACSPQEVRGILTSSADDIGTTGWDHYTGAGRLNIRKALQTVGASNVQILSPENDGGSALASVPVVVSALDPQFLRYHLEYQAGTAGTSTWLPIKMDIAVQSYRDTVAYWNVNTLGEGEYTLRLRMEKTNGSTAEDRIRFVVDRSAPVIDLRRVVHAWDNEQHKVLWVYRAADRSTVSLHYKALGSSTFKEQVSDRTTRHGSFLLGIDALGAGPFAYYLSARNEAGLEARTPLDTFNFVPKFVQLSGFDTLQYALPMGYYIPDISDFDGDGLKEVAMSKYDDNLGFGPLKYYEYNATQFTAADSVTLKKVLIPKGITDTDGDGLQEVLCSVNDSIFIVEQGASGTYPKNGIYANLGNDLFAARFANADADNATELIFKDFRDYKIFNPDGSGGYVETQTLADNSGGYIGSVAPRALVEDFDGDGQNEIVFGDFDGDFLIYEFDGSGYVRTFLDTTSLTKSGTYLTAGDFDGDGIQEIFVAVHTSLNRNEIDFEYEPLYWWLRIFKATGNNQYAVTWEDFLFDIDTEQYNAATAGNIDTDAADELIFTTFPRTYILDFVAGNYQMDWFHYGDLATHHFVGDFNGNGVNEVAIGRGDKAIFWEKNFNYQGPKPIAFLDGYVAGADKDVLRWSAESSASSYRIWRGPILGNGNILINLIDSTSNTVFVDSIGLVPNTNYLYVLESKNALLAPQYSPFSYPIVLRPHALGRLDSVVATAPLQAKAYFSVPIVALPEAAQSIALNDTTACQTLNASGDQHTSILLSFAAPLAIGSNHLTIDSTFLDADRASLDPAFRQAFFTYAPDNSERAFFTNWKINSNSTAQISFNFPMTSSVLDASLYRLAPSGRVVSVAFADGSDSEIVVTIEGAAFGALGYPVSVILQGGMAQNGAPMMEKSGNVATFSAFEPDLTQAYVYPNPWLKHSEFEGLRFANLTQQATIYVMSASGRKIITLQESDGDGGLQWNMIDLWGDRIRPGLYLFRVEAEGKEDFVGKFEILE
jgi:subtilisin family serine protease